MGEWREVRLGDLVQLHNRRRVPLSKVERASRQGEFRYFGAQGVIDHIDDYLFDGKYMLVAEDGENLRSRKQPVASLVSGRFWVNNHAHILDAVQGKADLRFLFHAINQSSLNGLITGAAQPKLTMANLRRLSIPVPSFVIQQRIAAVLSAFDDLIEINERRIELLEDLARSLYREWFVRFRFPGDDGLAFVESELGPTPRDWPIKRLSEIFTLNPPEKSERSTLLKVSMADVSERFSYVVPSSSTDRPGGTRFRRDDVLLARITPCLENGKTALVKFLAEEQVAVGSTEFIVLRGIRVGPAFAYATARSPRVRQHAIGSMSGASGRQRVARDSFEALELVEPPEPVATAFERIAGPQLQCVYDLHEQNRSLASTRDLLLPRLVTGRLDIDDIDLGDLLPAEAA